MKRTAFKAEGTKVAGPYSQAVEADGWVYLSGQTPMDFETGKLIVADMGKQAEQCFANLKRVADAAGLTWDNIVKVNVFLTDMSKFAEMNAAYGKIFEAPYPARTTVAVAALPLGAEIEIDMVARR
jgi:2-iminobutanoate/2-iminopropanoate deaminase